MRPETPLVVLLLVTLITRLVELSISRRNLAALDAHAARTSGVVRVCESGTAFGAMVAVHVLLLTLPAIENAWSAPRTPPLLFACALVLWCAGQALRWASVRALGVAWNARGAVSSTQPVVTGGLYSRLRHPNYLGVLLEGAALPLAGSAWVSLALLGPALAAVTWRRMRAEERLLADLPAWRAAFLSPSRLAQGSQ